MRVMKRVKGEPDAPGLADIPTSIWAHFRERMGLREWVRVAGTCKASWAVHYNEIMTFSHYSLDVSGIAGLREPSCLYQSITVASLSPCHCYAGWQSSLKRCIGATSMTIYLRSPRTADALLHALQIQQTKGNLQSVRELRYSGHHCGGDAFVTLAAMCPNIQASSWLCTCGACSERLAYTLE